MHVVIANLTSGGMSGGSRKYLQRMVPLLHGHSRISKLDVIVPPQFAAALREETGANVSTWTAADSRRGFRELVSQWAATPPNALLIPAARMVRIENVPTVVMMRNMEPPLFPFRRNPLAEATRNVARAWYARRACQQATHVIAVSDFVRSFLTESWRVAGERVTRIYHGIEAPPPRAAVTQPAKLSAAAGAFQLFTAGSIRPARGLEDLVHAMAELKEKYGTMAHLWIAGNVDPGMARYANHLRRIADQRQVAGQIQWLGGLSASEMSWCFYHCHTFVMTSRAEACPNVVLEAMVHGCPAISVDAAPMPEFWPTTTGYYRANDALALAEQLKRFAQLSASERARWQAAALVRAADFSWQRTAQETAALLSRLGRDHHANRKAA